MTLRWKGGKLKWDVHSMFFYIENHEGWKWYSGHPPFSCSYLLELKSLVQTYKRLLPHYCQTAESLLHPFPQVLPGTQLCIIRLFRQIFLHYFRLHHNLCMSLMKGRDLKRHLSMSFRDAAGPAELPQCFAQDSRIRSSLTVLSLSMI